MEINGQRHPATYRFTVFHGWCLSLGHLGNDADGFNHQFSYRLHVCLLCSRVHLLFLCHPLFQGQLRNTFLIIPYAVIKRNRIDVRGLAFFINHVADKHAPFHMHFLCCLWIF